MTRWAREQGTDDDPYVPVGTCIFCGSEMLMTDPPVPEYNEGMIWATYCDFDGFLVDVFVPTDELPEWIDRAPIFRKPHPLWTKLIEGVADQMEHDLLWGRRGR